MGRSQSKAGRLGSSMDVFLLPRDVLLFRDFPERCLPHFQDIKEYLKVRTVTFLDILNHNLGDVLVVSHRWESPDNPDVTGDQLRAMRSYLLENEQFKFVWFDFSCLPQRTRNSLEECYFQTALENVNLLYLHAHVLVIFDRDYNRRFWCLFESFLGCRVFDGTTLVGGSGHLDVRCVGSLSKLPAKGEEFKKETDHFSVDEFVEMLQGDDIQVTNKSDKDKQLKKLNTLSSQLQQLHQERGALSSSPAESAESAEKSVDEALRDVFHQNADKKAMTEAAITKLREISPKAAQELSRVLQENSTTLDFCWIPLWRNYNIGDAGAAALAEALMANGTIEYLYLDGNSIGAGGARALADALKANGTITTVCLQRNSIGAGGAGALADALKANGTIKILVLTGNNISDGGARALADALQVNGAITTLLLWNNDIGDAGATALAEAIRENDSLKTLWVNGNFIGETGKDALRKAQEVRRSRGKDVTIWY